MKIIFVCKYNRFRSKVAETIFNKLNQNPKIESESAGLLIDESRSYIAKNVLSVMQEKGYAIPSGHQFSKQLTSKIVNNYDLMIIVADNVEESFFHDFKGRIIKWHIKDCGEEDIENIKKRVEQIEFEVNKLIKNLKT